MANVRSRAALGQLQSLFHVGIVSGLTDRQLLERFHSSRGAVAEVAFQALVERHGAMVLGVCRRILSDPHDADDAFQATFLILFQRAGSVSVDDSLGRWLHGVSYRVALRAKARAARRKRLERGASGETAASPTNEIVNLDIRTVLDEELNRLPDKYRAPVVLYHLQGLSQDETARTLGWPLGTVQGRLARARATLRDRLTRRGMVPSAWGPIGGLFARPLSETVPEILRHRTLKAVMRRAAGEAALAGTGSTSAIALAEGFGGTMVLTKLKLASVLIVLGFIGTSTTAPTNRATADQHTPAEQTTTQFASAPDSAQAGAELNGRTPAAEREAKLTMTLVGPKKRDIETDTNVKFSLSVENVGAAVARDVRVQVLLPWSVRLVQLPPNAKFDAKSRRLTWEAFALHPGKIATRSLTFEVRMRSHGIYEITAQAVGEQGLTAKDTVRTHVSKPKTANDASDQGRTAKEITSTDVITLAMLDLKITEDRRVIDVDQRTNFTIKIVNRGSKAATQILIWGKHSDNIVVKSTAGTDEPARYKQGGSGKPIDGEFFFPVIPRLEPGKEVDLSLKVQALKPGLATCRVFLSLGGSAAIEDVASFGVPRLR